MNPKQNYYDKRGQLLVKNLRSRHFDACYCPDRRTALEKVLEWIPQDALVGWGGTLTAQQIGLMDVLRSGGYRIIDRDAAADPRERAAKMKQCFQADVFITGANALSMDGQMVNIDGVGNRVAAIVYGPDTVIVVAGMNKVADTLEAAVTRARSVAAPTNMQRFSFEAPCSGTGLCMDCRSKDSICNQILITRCCSPAGRIKVVLVGEELGF